MYIFQFFNCFNFINFANKCCNKSSKKSLIVFQEQGLFHP